IGLVRLQQHLRKDLNISTSVAELFAYSSVETLARHIVEDSSFADVRLASRQMRPHAHVGPMEADEPIAIVSMACRLPQCETPAACWRLLESGRDAITSMPWEGGYVSCGVVDSKDWFDADFFRISPREARRMDSRQRLALEVSWEALERAGIVPSELEGSTV